MSNNYLKEAKLAYKLLTKRFGIKDVSRQTIISADQKFYICTKVGSWIKKVDKNNDGKLSRREFTQSVMSVLQKA